MALANAIVAGSRVDEIDQAGEKRLGPVVMVTGAYPPDVCGVGDYTDRLMSAAPNGWRLFVERNWSWPAAPGVLRRLFRLSPSSVIIQYPTQGYGWSLIPHLLVVAGRLTRRYRSVLALHEFTSLSQKARKALGLASHFASHVIFTTVEERDHARRHRWFSRRVATSVVGILSNIPFAAKPPGFSERAIDIAYFGHIRANKGLEAFLKTMAGVRHVSTTVRIAVIGEIPAGYEAFGAQVAADCADIGCELVVGLDDRAAGRMLADTRMLYLPFQDGVSARRGSVLAGLGNGAIVATRLGDATPPALARVVVPCAGGPADVDTLLEILDWSESDARAMQLAGYQYIAEALPRDWAHIAELYEAVLA